MPGEFDDLIPSSSGSGTFDDLIPKQPSTKPASWFERQAPLKALYHGLAEIPGKLEESLGTVLQATGTVSRKQDRTPSEIIEDVERDPLVALGRKSQQEAAAIKPLTPEEETGITTRVARGAASMVPYVFAGKAAPALIGLESFSDHLTKDFEAEKSKGRKPDDAAMVAFTKALGSGALQAAVFEFIPPTLKKLSQPAIDRFAVGLISRFIAKRAAQSGETAGLFALSRVGENIVSGESPLKDVGESAASGALLGGVTPYGDTKRDYFNRMFPQAPPGAEPPQIPQRPVPIAPGPLGVIPEGGTVPLQPRIRLKLNRPTVSETTPPVPASEIPKQESPSGLFPAIRLIGGDVVVGKVGETHPEIAKREKINVTEIDQKGFVDKQGKFLDREQAAQITQLPTQFEEGRLHAPDLPEKGPSDQTKTTSEESKIVQTSAVPPVGGIPPVGTPTVETKVGVAQPKGPDQTPPELKAWEKFWDRAKGTAGGDTPISRAAVDAAEKRHALSLADDPSAPAVVIDNGGRWIVISKPEGKAETLSQPEALARFDIKTTADEWYPVPRDAKKPPLGTPPELKIPPAEELSSKTIEEFDQFFRSLGERKQEAQQQTANTTSPVKLRQFATEAAGDFVRLRNDSKAKLKAGGTLTEDEMNLIGKASTKMQYFNEALREAGEQPVAPPIATPETQIGRRKKGDRRPVMGSATFAKENRLAAELEKVENDWSVATQQGKVQVNADELKTDDVIVVRGEALNVTAVDEEGNVTLKGPKGGRWGDRTLQPGQQIGVDEYRPGKETGFEPKEVPPPLKLEPEKLVAKQKGGKWTVEGIPGEFATRAEAEDSAAGKKPSVTTPVTDQKFRVDGQGPQLYTLVERLPQSESEKNLGEQPVRVRNDKTGKEEVVLETQLQSVQLRTAEEKAATKGMTKRELDDLLRKFGMEPSEFSNSAQKREALKRARAKAGEREAAVLVPPERIREKIKTVSEKDQVEIGKKIREVEEARSQLTQGSSGSKWNAILTRQENIDRRLEALGFSKTRDASGETEIESAERYLRNKALLAEREAALGPVFYSRIERAVETSTQGKASGAQWKASIKNKGVSSDEWDLVKVTDLEDGKTYTKHEVLDYLRANKVEVKNVTLGGESTKGPSWYIAYKDGPTLGGSYASEDAAIREMSEAFPGRSDLEVRRGVSGQTEGIESRATHQAAPTKFAQYTLPGAKEGSYREVLLTNPDRPTPERKEAYRAVKDPDLETAPRSGNYVVVNERGDVIVRGFVNLEAAETEANRYNKTRGWSEIGGGDEPRWYDGHTQYSDIPNPIVRLRFNERRTADGKRMLFIEEIQAPQKGQFQKMPALFQKQWREIGMRWALRYAAENGFDSVGWTTGEQQADRYDLSKQVSSEGIKWNWHPESETYTVFGETADTLRRFTHTVKPKDLESFVGKDVAQQIYDTAKKGIHVGQITGEDLKVGGAGLKKFYDVDLRNVVNSLDVVKKSGQKVGTERIQISDSGTRKYVGPEIPLEEFEATLLALREEWKHNNNRWNVALDKQAEDVAFEMQNGATYSDAMQYKGSGRLAREFGGDIRFVADSDQHPVQSISISPDMRESVLQGQRLAAFAEKKDAVILGKPIELATSEDIRRAIADPKLNITNDHRKALDWLVSSGMMEKLPGLRLEITDYIRGGAVGEYVGNEGVARFLRWTDADVPIHEFMHHVWRYLDAGDRAFISSMRQEMVARLAPQMGEEFRLGLSSDAFLEKGISRDLYHLANDSEFFVWLMTEKAQIDMNKPQAAGFVQKIRKLIRDLWNGFRDALGFSKYQDALWRQILSGKYEYRTEDGFNFGESAKGRELALVRSRRDAAEQTINYNEMSESHKKEMGTDIELQNNFVEPLAARLVQGRSRGITSKLNRVFGDRLAALAEGRGRGERYDVRSYEELMADPNVSPETKQIIVGDMEKNVRSFRDTANQTIILSDKKIEDYQKKIVQLSEDLDVQKARREVLTKAARKIVSDYQNRYLNRIRQGGQAGEVSASAEVMRNLQNLKQSPDIIGRIIDQIATTVPDDILNQPGVTAPQLIQALMDNNGGNLETLSAAMGEAQRGVGREMLQTAIGIMQASDQLAENVLAIRPTINPEDIQAIQSLAVELRDAARRGARADMRQLIREVGGTAETLSKVRGAIGRLQPRLRRAARQLEEWFSTQEILEQARNDPALKELERKVYAHFDVRSVAVTEGGDHEFTIRNPLTNEEVKILPGLDKLNTQSNYAKLQKLFDDAAVYISNPDDPNFDPRMAAAWRYMIENTQQFWLNPATNMFVPHMTPFKLDLPAFLSDPFKVLRTNAGLEASAAQVKLNAMSNVKKMLMEWDRRTGTSVDIANKKAAAAAKMTLDDWYTHVFDEIAFRHQYLGQVLPRVGDVLLSGHKITAADMEAVKTNFNYLKRVRDIAENAPGFTAAAVNPVRVIQQGISRRAEPTGPMTLPGKRSTRALQWGMQWRRIQDWTQRMVWLNDPERFNRIVVGHMDTFNTPGYTVPSMWRDLYKGIVSDIRREEGPESIQEIAEILYESQDLDELGPNAMSREQIQQGIVNEIGQAFDNFEREGQDAERPKPPPLVEALTAENSFTKPRSDKVSAPFTFYDYGVRDYPGRLRMANDAYNWYSLDFVKSLERLQSALKLRITSLTEGLTPKEAAAVQKATKTLQQRGDEFFDLAEMKLNHKRISTLLTQITKVLQASHGGRSSFESLFYRIQSTVGAYILMTPGARSTHTFGMLGNSAVFNALIENRFVRPMATSVARLVGSVVKDVLKSPVSIPGLRVSNEDLRAWTGIAKVYADLVINRREQMQRLQELGYIPESDVRGAWESNLLDFQNVFRRESPEALATRIIKAGEGLSDLHNAFWLAWSPQRYNDWVLNSPIREARQDFTRHLQENALKHIRNRAEILGTGYSDFSRPENILTPQELTGRKGPSAEREAFEKRLLFKQLGLDLDQIMLRYFRAVDEAQSNNADPNQIPLLTKAEENSLDFEFAKGFGLSTPGTRNLAAQGSLLRRAAGYIHGLPLSTMGRYLSLFNRLSNQRGPKYAAAVLPAIVGASLAMTLMGLSRITSTSALNRLFYNQSSALPTLSQAKTLDDWARLLVRAYAGWFPFVGDIVMGALLRTPDRFGHLDSMFVMYNFFQDLINMGGDMWHTKDVVGPARKFGERWMPPVKILTRRLTSQTGVRDHYNAVADIQSALPSSMETAASKFRGGIRPTETTPMTYRALNAMYNSDWTEFEKVAAEYTAKKEKQGVKDGFLAFKHSVSAHNPWVERLGKLPTEDEREKILSRMTDEQKKEVEKAENVFREFGQRYGTRVAFTQQQAEAERGAAGGSGEPTAGVGNVKAGLPGRLGGAGGAGGITLPRGTLPPGLKRISVGRVTSPISFIGGRRPVSAALPRRLGVSSSVGRARRYVSGKLRVSRPRAGRRRIGLGRRRRSAMV